MKFKVGKKQKLSKVCPYLVRNFETFAQFVYLKANECIMRTYELFSIFLVSRKVRTLIINLFNLLYLSVILLFSKTKYQKHNL